ncbi:unnamed protein product [Owenia fusiformis]|uniref:Glycerophosphocholine acyltransferase 1 n=1 Tax=Owenia fusiformis TaxID=6347 RepID=A0A8S4NNY3_OWEFU|nr:unnamed protein product [Owenia fusiformis]
MEDQSHNDTQKELISENQIENENEGRDGKSGEHKSLQDMVLQNIETEDKVGGGRDEEKPESPRIRKSSSTCNQSNQSITQINKAIPNLKKQTQIVKAEGNTFVQVTKKKRILEKIIFVVSVSTMITMAYCMMSLHWFLPYYYTASSPILIFIRIVTYWKNKWQFFLIDFCYFGNILTYVFLWAQPSNIPLFGVVFAYANGPLLWAALFFRNSLVFHSNDKMTSVYIHTIPAFISYVVHWFPSSTSTYWYTDFVTEHLALDRTDLLFLYLVLLPFTGFILHSLLYAVLVHAIIRPSKEYTNSQRFLSSKEGLFHKLLNGCGKKYEPLVYNLLNYTYCLLTLFLGVLWYLYFIAHTIFIVTMMLVIIWNGASYYIDQFGNKGASEEKK